MCDPVTAAIVVGVTATASSVASVVQQTKTYNRQRDAINAQQAVMAEENRLAASAEIFDRDREARREQGRIRAAAGEAGLGLNSGAIEQLLMDSTMQAGLANDRSLANMESRIRAGDAEANSMRSRLSAPTALGAGLQVASTAASAWSGIQTAKIQTGKN